MGLLLDLLVITISLIVASSIMVGLTLAAMWVIHKNMADKLPDTKYLNFWFHNFQSASSRNCWCSCR